LRAGDAPGAIKVAEGGVLLAFSGEVFLILREERVAPRASRARRKIAGCWRADGVRRRTRFDFEQLWLFGAPRGQGKENA
jgi:hypothetical protein